MGKICINDNQIDEWKEVAEGIQDQFGIEKTFGYVIGEKFFQLSLYASRFPNHDQGY